MTEVMQAANQRRCPLLERLVVASHGGPELEEVGRFDDDFTMMR
jgi:hypothetical protein